MDLLRDLDGNMIRGTKERRLRWKQHFESLLNVGAQQLTPNEAANRRPPEKVDDEPLPSEADVERAIKSLKNGKAAGFDGVHAEMLKAGGNTLVKWIHRLIARIWQDEVVPDDWSRAVVVPFS